MAVRDAFPRREIWNPEIVEWVESLRRDSLRLFIFVSSVVYFVWHIPHVVIGVADTSLQYWFIFMFFAPGVLVALLLHGRQPRLASGLFLLACIATVGSMISILATPIPTIFLPILAFAAVVLLHPAAGVAVVAISSLMLGASGSPSVVELPRLLETLSAGTLSVVTAWALGRNTTVAAGWALSSYEQARRNAEEAQRHRGELVQALKQLDDAYWRLEQLNLDLERARRAAHEARRLKEQFAMSVSHELRTPLNLVLGFCEMMVIAPTSAYGHRLPAAYRGDLEAMYRNASHLSELVDDILDLSQIDADRMALHREWIALSDVVTEAMSAVETLFLHRDLTLRSTIGTDLPPLFVDRTRIRQIVINLLGNAARFVEQGGVTIAAWIDDATIVLSVTDTGPGIAPEDLPYIFLEFRQVGDAGRRRGGSGLGLAVSKRFAELHGGDLWVESTLRQGSSFFVRLPIVSEDGAPLAAGAQPWDDRVASRVRGAQRRRLVVVDEKNEVHTILKRYLDDFDVLRVRDIEESVQQGRLEPIQAVVLGSPGALAQWNDVSRNRLELLGLPIITCALRTTRTTAEALAVDDYLLKPVTREQLRAAIHRLPRRVASVLIVDDDPGMTRLLARMVRSISHGTTVRTASDGMEALDIVRNTPPDLILLDLLMPRIDGYALLDTLRDESALEKTSVIVVSARGLHDESIVATSFSVTRDRGLSVGEMMRWLKAGLTSLLEVGTTVPESSEEHLA